MTCATCQHWQLKASSLARHGFAPCAHGKPWESLPDHHTCAQHKAASSEISAARVKWLAPKTTKGMT